MRSLMRASKSLQVTATFLFALVQYASGQCDSLMQVASSDSGFTVGSMYQGNPISHSTDEFAPKFVFAYQADSSYSRWTFTEFLLNKRKLFLSNWCMQRRVNYDSASDDATLDWTEIELRNRSITRTFPIKGNDTIQFYRNLKWIDRLTGAVSFNRYVNVNGLAYSVELVNSSTHTRVLLLDTFNISPTTGSKKPCIYSWYPMASRIRNITPTAMDSIAAYIKVNVWTSGENAKPFMRGDTYGFMMSATDLASTEWQSYNDSVEVNIDCGSFPSCGVAVSTLASPSRLIVGYAWPSSLQSLRVCSASGAVVWMGLIPSGTNPTMITLPPGLYIVLGLNSSQVVCTKKVILP